MMKTIAPDLYLLTEPVLVNMYLIKDPDGLTLIDTSIPPAGKWVIKVLEKAGWKASDLKRILITHAHPDHVGGLKYLKEQTGARVYASAPEKEVIEGRIPVPSRKKWPHMPTTWPPVSAVDQVICEGDVLPEVMGGMHVLDTPGHAPGHVTFWHPEKKIAIAGDVFFHVFGLGLPPGPLTVDMEENKRSIGRLAGLDIDILCLGHGAPIVVNTTDRVRQFAAKKGIKVQEQA
jgi:glyoxylase-like metal-dependent hydrolase (beta-lactamase superfamily II)